MTIPRFPLPDGQPFHGRIILSGNPFRHLVKVLRAKPGDQVFFYDREGYEYPSTIEHISRYEAICISVQRIEKEKEPCQKITLFQGLLKKEKMDLLIQKATELGVYKIIPIITERSQVKVRDEKIDSRIRHWERIAEAATSQCRRNFIPLIEPPKLFKKAILELKPECPNLFLSENAKEKNLKEIIRELKSAKEISIMIGPPGGFTDKEVITAEGKGWYITGLKGTILRSETAAISILSIVQYELGNL